MGNERRTQEEMHAFEMSLLIKILQFLSEDKIPTLRRHCCGN